MDDARAQSLQGEVAVVTGGSRGIGLATVAEFLEQGAKVVFCGRDPEVGAAAERDLGAGGSVHFEAADVGVEADLERVAAVCRERFGSPTVLVNNAGVNANFDATEMTEDEWDRFFAI